MILGRTMCHLRDGGGGSRREGSRERYRKLSSRREIQGSVLRTRSRLRRASMRGLRDEERKPVAVVASGRDEGWQGSRAREG